MPLIDGQKMACMPCIRGHRSTKCTHFNERPMIPVRKPGRPLSTCPCIPGKQCSCGSGVKVAIPRTRKCGCGSENLNELGIAQEHVHTHAQPNSRFPPQKPASPTRPSSNRVSKPVSGSKNTGRKRSFDAAALNRADPNSFNLLPSGPGLDATTMTMVANPITSSTSPAVAGFETGITFPPTPSYSSPQGLDYSIPMSFNMNLQFSGSGPIKAEEVFSPSHPGPFDMAMPPLPYRNGATHTRSHSRSGPTSPINLGPSPIVKATGSITNTGGSCCGGSNNVNGPTGLQQSYNKPPAPLHPSLSSGNNARGVVNSSGGNNPGIGINGVSSTNGINGMPNLQGGYNDGFGLQPQAMDMKPLGINTAYTYPTTFTYPAHYGSWQHPVNPAMWQQIVSQSGPPMGALFPTTTTNGTPGGMGLSHECGCGEGCQCVGCLAHPFNDRMFQYVSDAYTEREQSPKRQKSSCCGGGSDAENTTPTQAPAPESPPEAHTPSDGSGLAEEPVLHHDNYFFVDIPVRRDHSCMGNLQLCPCGDDCECIGCLVHNAPPVSPI